MPKAEIKAALVFGATSAIAQEVVRLLAARGAKVALVARDAGKLDAVAADARVRGAEVAFTRAADLNDTALHEALLADAFAALGAVDLVLLAQGTLADSDACEAAPEAAEAVLETNFTAPALLAQRAGLRLADQGAGVLAAISSVAGDRGRQSNYAYGAAKGGLSVFLDGLRNRLFRRGVHVLVVKPGFVDTPMTAHLPKNALFADPAAVAKGLLHAAERRQDTAYLPGFWRVVMFAVRSVPEVVFKRLKL